MITVKNYFEEIQKVNLDQLPEAFMEGHRFVVAATEHGSDWESYELSEKIKDAIDSYIGELNRYLTEKKQGQAKQANAHAGYPIEDARQAERAEMEKLYLAAEKKRKI